MADLGPYVRTLDVPEPLEAPIFPIKAPQKVEEGEEVVERELVPARVPGKGN